MATDLLKHSVASAVRKAILEIDFAKELSHIPTVESVTPVHSGDLQLDLYVKIEHGHPRYFRVRISEAT